MRMPPSTACPTGYACCRDVFELLPELERKGEKFDLVILDPPAFTKSRAR